ncbi:uncharacterized protein JCM10292_007608 [Rhodotorula paludigena]|uniref:uncharacterized protein n=1 Tax=Rhodotorula paludigena TaxID=86838 RepID=UPI00317C385C
MAMETGSHDAPVETLPDPTTLTPQEGVDRLVEAVESDDLLGVVLFLKFLEKGEVNARSGEAWRLSKETDLQELAHWVRVRTNCSSGASTTADPPDAAMLSIPTSALASNQTTPQSPVGWTVLCTQLQPRFNDTDKAAHVDQSLGASFHQSRSPSPVQSKDGPEFWITVTDIPPAFGERWLFDTLSKDGVIMQDCLVGPLCFDTHLSAHPFYDDRTNSDRPDFGGTQRRQDAYLGTRRNAANASHATNRLIIVKHLPDWAEQRRVIDFVDCAVGERLARKVDVLQPKGKHEKIAIVDFHRHSDAVRAFEIIDGATFDGRAVAVLWKADKTNVKQGNNAQASDEALLRLEGGAQSLIVSHDVTPEPATPGPSQRNVATNVSTRPADDSSESLVDPVLLPSPPLPPIQQAMLNTDLSRLRSPIVGLSERRIAALQRIWDASDTPLRQDEVQQKGYEEFLRAQAGESRDWYMFFLESLAQHNRLGSTFVDNLASSVPVDDEPMVLD